MNVIYDVISCQRFVFCRWTRNRSNICYCILFAFVQDSIISFEHDTENDSLRFSNSLLDRLVRGQRAVLWRHVRHRVQRGWRGGPHRQQHCVSPFMRGNSFCLLYISFSNTNNLLVYLSFCVINKSSSTFIVNKGHRPKIQQIIIKYKIQFK